MFYQVSFFLPRGWWCKFKHNGKIIILYQHSIQKENPPLIWETNKFSDETFFFRAEGFLFYFNQYSQRALLPGNANTLEHTMCTHHRHVVSIRRGGWLPPPILFAANT